MKNVGAETACFQAQTLQAFPKKQTPEVRGQLMRSPACMDPKEAFSEVTVHAETTKLDFEVDRPSPEDSPPGDLLIAMVKEIEKNIHTHTHTHT